MAHNRLTNGLTKIDALYNFVFDISNSYHNSNPYHNFRHAVDVMQSNYYFLCKMGVLSPMDKNTYAVFSKTRGGVGFSSSSSSPPPRVVVRLRDLLRPLDVFALMMASIGHDLCHPGVTNMFLVTNRVGCHRNKEKLLTLLYKRSIHAHHSPCFTMTGLFSKAITRWRFSTSCVGIVSVNSPKYERILNSLAST